MLAELQRLLGLQGQAAAAALLVSNPSQWVSMCASLTAQVRGDRDADYQQSSGVVHKQSGA